MFPERAMNDRIKTQTRNLNY